MNMKLHHILLVAFLTAITLDSVAQNKTVIDGYVKGADGKAADAYVTVSPKGKGIILGFADVDVASGYYKVEFAFDTDSIVVTAAGMTIGQNIKIVPNRSQRLDFLTVEQSITIKEVSIVADKIRRSGDTINYNVAAYKQQDDRVIADVIKRMPGMEVSESGGIKYNGQSISKFYIEDMDMLHSRYGLATKNVSAQDVATVQVMENHQAIKSLQGKEITDQVAVNLKLRPEAKGTFSLNAMLGGGAQLQGSVGSNPLMAGEATAMYFGKRRQHMTVYKGDNAGNDVSTELTEQYNTGGVGLYPFCPMGAVMPSSAGLPKRRYLDNRTHVVGLNHLEKLNKDTELTLNATYHNDDIRREGYTMNDRFVTADTRLVTEETLTSETHLHNLNAQAHYQWNANEGFFNNRLQVKGSWNRDAVTGTLTSNALSGAQRVTQRFDRPEFSIKNTANTIRSIGDNNFRLNFSVGAAHRPSTLGVSIDSTARYTQDITSQHYAATFHTGYGIGLGNFRLNYGINFVGGIHHVESDLDGYTLLTGSALQNDVWYRLYELVLGQEYTYKYEDFKATLTLPLNLNTQNLDDRIHSGNYHHMQLLVAPSLALSYTGNELSGGASVRYHRNVGNPNAIYQGAIMTNYRTFQRDYVDRLFNRGTLAANADVRYANSLSGTFANAEFGYTRLDENVVYGYRYDGVTSIVEGIEQDTHSDTYRAGASLSQGLNWWQATMSLFVNASLTQDEQYIGGIIYPMEYRSLSFGGAGTITPIRQINLVFSSGCGMSQSYVQGGAASARTITTATHRLTMNLHLTKKLTLSASAEDSYNNLTDENRHHWFADAKVKYKMKRIDLEVEASNLFNQQAYTQVNYSNLNIYRNVCQLRPMNVVAKVRFKLL